MSDPIPWPGDGQGVGLPPGGEASWIDLSAMNKERYRELVGKIYSSDVIVQYISWIFIDLVVCF